MFEMRRTGSQYAIYHNGEHLRDVPLDEVGPQTIKVIRANAVNSKRLDEMAARAKRMAAARRALAICGRLGKSRARLTRQTMIAANKARAHV